MRGQKINLMISSRCRDQIKVRNEKIMFTELRKSILTSFEEHVFLGSSIFNVNINEEFIKPASQTAWDACLEEIRNNDIVLVLFTGHEGYKRKGQSIGICFAEYSEAVNSNPAKVYLLDFRKLHLLDASDEEITDNTKHNSPFALEIENSGKWLHKIEINETATKELLMEDVKNKCFEIIRIAVISFVLQGSKSFRQSKHQFGAGLRWSKLNYRIRKELIANQMKQGIESYVRAPEFSLLKNSYLCHAIPDAMGVAEAREMVGRPFLEDSKFVDSASTNGEEEIRNGPIHFVGVYKNATEGQIRNLIGHQDVAIIPEDFGFYVWDFINHIQLVYLTNCKDPVITQMRVDAFFDWLRISQESRFIPDRAQRRFRILTAISQQKVDIQSILNS